MKKWIQRAISRPGKLHRDLGIPKGEKIPMSLLNKIVSAKAGDKIINPTKVGNKKILVSRKIEQRAILARNLKRIRK